MRIPKNEVGKMKIVPISPKDKKDIGDMVLAIGEEVNLDERIDTGKSVFKVKIQQGNSKMFKTSEFKTSGEARRFLMKMKKTGQKGFIVTPDGQRMREENDSIKELIQSGKFTRPEIKKMIERNILEQRSATGYTLFHRSFSDAMQHAYAFARTKMGMVVDPKEIDNKVATGPKKPGTGKTNSYSLKTNKGMLQIQVYNTGSGAKPFELNMYSS